MKRLVFIITCALMAGSLWAQSKQLEALSELKGVEYVHFDKAALTNLAENKGSIDVGDNSIIKDAKGEILNLLDEVYVIKADASKRLAKKIKNAAQSFIKSNDLQSLFDITGNDYPKVKIYHAKNGDINTSALLVEEKDETFFVVLKGAFNLGGLLQGAIQGGGAI
jgi:hypothetical protein